LGWSVANAIGTAPTKETERAPTTARVRAKYVADVFDRWRADVSPTRDRDRRVGADVDDGVDNATEIAATLRIGNFVIAM
jgi:hypothetical protein